MSMEKNFEKALSWLKTYRTFAIVGANTNPEKYGYKYAKTLKEAGFNVIPVNPKYEEVVGLKCYPSLKDLDEKPDVVIAIVSPKISAKVAEACKELGLPRLWLPPETWNDEILAYCNENSIDVVYDICPLMATNYLLQQRSGG